MDAENVASLRNIFRRVQRVGISREAPAPCDDGHAERLRALGDFLPDAPVADDAERPAEQPLRLRVLLLVPRPRAQVDDVLRDAAVESEDQREWQLRDRDGVLSGAVRDVVPQPRPAVAVAGGAAR